MKIYNMIHWTWCLPQTFIGFVLYCILKKTTKIYESSYHKNSVVLEVPIFLAGGLSMGKYLFVQNDNPDIKNHEYGHMLQSIILGPLFLFVIGIPSAVWFWSRKAGFFLDKNYYSFYPEKWADILGGVKRN